MNDAKTPKTPTMWCNIVLVRCARVAVFFPQLMIHLMKEEKNADIIALQIHLISLVRSCAQMLGDCCRFLFSRLKNTIYNVFSVWLRVFPWNLLRISFHSHSISTLSKTKKQHNDDDIKYASIQRRQPETSSLFFAYFFERFVACILTFICTFVCPKNYRLNTLLFFFVFRFCWHQLIKILLAIQCPRQTQTCNGECIARCCVCANWNQRLS